jgi:UMF1 family MFS transporter
MIAKPPQSSSRKQQLAYGWFDFANSSISLIFHAYLFPLYVKQHLFGNRPIGDTVWGLTFAMSVLLAAALAPFIGRAVDGRDRYRVFVWFSVASFLTIIVLGVAVGHGTWAVLALFVVANIAFFLASNVYDSLLTIVAEPELRAKISSFAWGFGYLGGIACFVGVFFLQRRFGLASTTPYVFAGLFYASFGVFALRRLKPFVQGYVRPSSVGIREMFKALDRYRVRNLVGYWLVGDCVNAVIVFTGIYAASQLGMTATTIGMLLLIVQLLAFPGTILMGRFARRFGVLTAIQVCGATWVVIIMILVFGRTHAAIVAVVLCTSLVIGSTQALMRAQYSLSVQPTRTSELFGWYALATESATFIAPLLFGVISGLLGNQRLAMAALGAPLVFGLLLLTDRVADAARPV